MLYKWPQGKILRTILLLLVVLLAVDLGWSAYTKIEVFLGPQGLWQQAVVGGILGVLAVVIFIGGIVAVGFHPRAAQFVIEVEQEMSRVTWPTSNEVWRFTIVIAIMTTILASLVFVVDLINKSTLDAILGTGG